MKRITLEQIGSSKPWVARITGRDPKYGLAREFVQGVRDYSDSNSVGTRGITSTYELSPRQIYEISAQRSWKRHQRYFAEITVAADGSHSLTELTAAEVQRRIAEVANA